MAGSEDASKKTLARFELLAEIKGDAVFRFGGTKVAACESADWTAVRLRVAGNRSQLWVDGRVHSDEIRETAFQPGPLTINGSEVRGLRLREL